MLVVMGATGNTGRATCEALLANGEMVTVVGRNLEKTCRLRPRRCGTGDR